MFTTGNVDYCTNFEFDAWPGVHVVRVLPGLGWFFMWSGFYLVWGGSSGGQGSTWSGVVLHVVRVLPGLGFYLAEGSSGRHRQGSM